MYLDDLLLLLHGTEELFPEDGAAPGQLEPVGQNITRLVFLCHSEDDISRYF